MLKFEECLRKERERVSHYLHSSTEPKLVEIVQNELLVTYANQLFEKEHSGCRALLRDVRVEDLSRMYRLYHEITNGLDPIANIFKQHITDEVMVFIKQAEDGAASNQAATSSVVQEQALIREILDLHDRRMVYVRGCFSNDFLFDKAWMEAFEEIFKKTVSGSSFAELLATFCHNILKKGRSEEWSDEAAMEETFEKVVKLVTYFSDKDLFAEFYRKKLARRLLFNRSADVERERRILSKLKLLYGAPFTSKMEVMLNDVMLARENQASFQEYLGNEPEAYTGVDLTVTVLSSFYWPSYKTFYLNPPAEMVRCVEVFETFYETQRKKRKLTSLGSCHINANFEQNSFELIVSTHQAAVLLLFNSADRLEYSEIMEQLNSYPMMMTT